MTVVGRELQINDRLAAETVDSNKSTRIGLTVAQGGGASQNEPNLA